MYGLISLIAIGIGLANDAISSNQKYYGTERDSFRNNPRVQKERIGTERLTTDILNGVSYEERQRRRMLGYYDGEDISVGTL